MDLKQVIYDLRLEYARLDRVIAHLERVADAKPVPYNPRIVVKRRGRPLGSKKRPMNQQGGPGQDISVA